MTNNFSVFSCIALALFSAAAIGCVGDVSDEEDPESIGAVEQALDLPDLIVQSYTQECERVGLLETGIKQTVVIKNQGAASAPSQTFRFTRILVCNGSPCPGGGIWQPTGAPLAAGATETFTQTAAIPDSGWTCTEWLARNGDWQITVDKPDYVDESNENNNVSTFANTF